MRAALLTVLVLAAGCGKKDEGGGGDAGPADKKKVKTPIVEKKEKEKEKPAREFTSAAFDEFGSLLVKNPRKALAWAEGQWKIPNAKILSCHVNRSGALVSLVELAPGSRGKNLAADLFHDRVFVEWADTFDTRPEVGAVVNIEAVLHDITSFQSAPDSRVLEFRGAKITE